MLASMPVYSETPEHTPAMILPFRVRWSCLTEPLEFISFIPPQCLSEGLTHIGIPPGPTPRGPDTLTPWTTFSNSTTSSTPSTA